MSGQRDSADCGGHRLFQGRAPRLVALSCHCGAHAEHDRRAGELGQDNCRMVGKPLASISSVNMAMIEPVHTTDPPRSSVTPWLVASALALLPAAYLLSMARS